LEVGPAAVEHVLCAIRLQFGDERLSMHGEEWIERLLAAAAGGGDPGRGAGRGGRGGHKIFFPSVA